MNRFSRISLIVLSLSLAVSFFLPIWKIDLVAPQYPEGLGMKIWINRLSGNLDTINGLNHYIGMKHIDADSIPELRYMSSLLAMIVITGLFAALAGKRWGLYVWVLIFACLGAAGGIDFYHWEYDYGHDLDPRAAIKVPGMSYQPPLLGTKQLLNFTAQSFPDLGGIIIITAGILAILLAIYNLLGRDKAKNTKDASAYRKGAWQAAAMVIGILLLGGCKAEPEKLDYGKDHCSFCKMGISDQRFGAELVTQKGKIYKFDAIECMVKFKSSFAEGNPNDFKYMLVEDASGTAALVDAHAAHYLHSEGLPSPMGANISAYSDKSDLDIFRKEFPGVVMDWKQVEEFILKRYE